jgi:hypothetical protein
MPSYDLGDLVRLTATFKDEGGSPVDPATLVLITRSPTGALTTLTYGTDVMPIRDSAGVFHADLSPDETGVWDYRWKATGAAQSAEPGQFRVRPEFQPLAQPSPADVAALVRVRLRDDLGQLQTTFTDATQPTLDQVQELIENETGLVTIQAGNLEDLACPDADQVRAAARQHVAKRVAAIVEASYRPEQIAQGMTVEDFYQGQRDAELTALVTAARECRAHGADEDDFSPPSPTGTFPPACPLRW